MMMFSEDVMKAIASMDEIVNLLDHKKDIDIMIKNNYQQELKKDVEFQRSYSRICEDTRIGYGAEKAIHKSGLFKQTSPITDTPRDMSFRQIKTDVECEGKIGDVKSKSAKYPEWYISKNQYKSIKQGMEYNDFYLVMAYFEINETKYRYCPYLLIDSKAIMRYIDITKETRYGSYTFNHRKAIADDNCVNLRSILS